MNDVVSSNQAVTVVSFDPSHVAQLRLHIDMQRGLISISTESTAPDTSDTPQDTQEFDRAALTQALVEQQLRQLFANVLTVPAEHLDRTADFFEYGGDSLAIVALLAAIAEQFQIVLEPSHIFDHPVLEDLANSVLAALSRKVAQA